ncbi:MAG: peptide MFS transporter [Mangrovibacterium sp.]
MSKAKDKAFFGHPVGLSTLFASEMWERFSYYGMRALLVLFLTATYVNGGFELAELDAFTIYGIFTAFVYVTPIIGGMLADKVLGQRKCIYIGGITMATGQFLLAASAMYQGNPEIRKILFFAGLGTLILGNGFFKPNISTMVGQLYSNNDPRKDGGFTIFYMGINIGAFLSPLVAGKLGEQVAWEYGFFSAGVGMLIGTTWFLLRSHTLERIGMPPRSESSRIRLALHDWVNVMVYALGVVALVLGILLGWNSVQEDVRTWIIRIIVSAGILYLLYDIVSGTNGKTEWSRVGVIVVLAVFNIFFWSGFEQAGTTFNIFARDNTRRLIGNWEIPASWFQSVNAIFIVLFAPMFSILWGKLDKVKLNPNTPMKFAWGMIALCLGFVIMAFAYTKSTGSPDGSILKVSPLWLVSVFMLHTFGELCLSPIGLSMVTKLSPPKIASTMMGLWMGSFAAGNFVASQMKAISMSLQETMNREVQVFWLIAIQSAIVAMILIILSPWLKRMMKGIK